MSGTYRIRTTGEVINGGELRGRYPNITFPFVLDAAALEMAGADEVIETPRPEVSRTQVAVLAGTQQNTDGKWAYVWRVDDKAPEVIAAEEVAQWRSIRTDRNARLAACDWTQLADAPGDKAAWAAYRQALRDITKQADPYAVNWPVAPQ